MRFHELHQLLTGIPAPVPHAGATTGEVFLMRPCSYGDRDNPAYVRLHRGWKGLKDTIESCGGEVRLLAPPYNHGQRSPIFVRDLGVFVDGAILGYPGSFQHVLLQPEMHTLRHFVRDAQEAPALVELGGRLDGGNIVPYAPASVLFVGVTHNDAKNDTQSYRQMLGHVSDADMRALYRRKQSEHLPSHLEACRALQTESRQRVVPIHIGAEHTGQFYHLDGALGVLPSGEAVVCREVLGHAALGMVEKYIGRERIIPVTREEALMGAANLITVGSHVIAPYASVPMREALGEKGYRVITPKDVGLSEGAWMFAPMGGVRCATLKITEDKGFPAPQQAVGRTL